MRIAQVAAYVSADGSYGGPVSVALDQARALHDAGHSVTVVAGWDGVADPHPADRIPFPLVLHRAYRPRSSTFAGMVAPGLLPWMARHVREFDVVHVHLTRDLVTLPAARTAQLRGVPLVVQTHGQIRPEASRLQRALDVLLTRRVLADAGAVLALTAAERADLAALGVRGELVQQIDNGVPPATVRGRVPEPGALVLYSSRLAERKRPRAFVAAAALVAAQRDDVRFELWGPDGGELAAVQQDITALGLGERCSYRGAVPVARARQLLGGASVFVLPSVAEPFPMALLEALSAGVPLVITDQTGLSDAVAAAGAGAVTDGSPEQLAAAVLRLLDDPERWQTVSASARDLVAQRFSMVSIAARLTEIYSRL
jgi:glycosyltransferase involved in cell wall biosynthesis